MRNTFPGDQPPHDARSLAVVDVGSNAIRLLITEVDILGRHRTSCFKRFALRLGADVFATGKIGTRARDSLLEVFTTIARTLHQTGCAKVDAVATSAMREATNGERVAAQIRAHSGVNLQIIDGCHESRLSRLALNRSVGGQRPGALLIDLGGGSLELERPSGRSTRSLPFGTVRILNQHQHLRDPLAPRQYERLRDALVKQMRPMLGAMRRSKTVFGTGGNLAALAALLPPTNRGNDNNALTLPEINLSNLDDLGRRAVTLSNVEKMRLFDLRADRADLLVPAIAVVAALSRLQQMQRLLVPGTGLREGLLAQRCFDMAALSPLQRRLSGLRPASDPGSRPATGMLKRVFEATACLHRLMPTALRPMLLACALRDTTPQLPSHLHHDTLRAARDIHHATTNGANGHDQVISCCAWLLELTYALEQAQASQQLHLRSGSRGATLVCRANGDKTEWAELDRTVIALGRHLGIALRLEMTTT